LFAVRQIVGDGVGLAGQSHETKDILDGAEMWLAYRLVG
jgi:hypothetical protein